MEFKSIVATVAVYGGFVVLAWLLIFNRSALFSTESVDEKPATGRGFRVFLATLGVLMIFISMVTIPFSYKGITSLVAHFDFMMLGLVAVIHAVRNGDAPVVDGANNDTLLSEDEDSGWLDDDNRLKMAPEVIMTTDEPFRI